MAEADPDPSMPAPAGHASTLAPLGVPIFRAVWVASIVSNFGMLIQSVGASWMMVSLGASPQMVALVQASTTLPVMLFALWSGALADNLDRRRIMLAAQAFMLLVSVLLSAAAFLGLLTPVRLLAFTFLVGCGTAIVSPSWQAAVGDLVPRPLLPGAVALNSMGFNIARTVGPAVGGAVVAAGGAAAAFLLNAFSYVGIIVVLARWRPEPAPRLLPRERIVDAMAAGVRYAAMSPTLWTVVLRAGIFGLAASAVPAMMPLIARDLVGGGPLTYGLLLGAFGAGAVGGALSSTRLRRRWSTERIVRGAIVAAAAGSFAAGLSRFVPLTVVALAAAGGGWVLALSCFNTTVQMASPRWVVGRTLSLYQMVAFGGMAGGASLAGAVASAHGVAAALAVAAVLALAGLVVGLRLPLPELADLDLGPFARWNEPDTAIAIAARSGPVEVSIEYRIAEPDIPAFLTAMTERRRVRIRDGARRWRLMRDLGEPDLWVERYEFPTWTEYVRHHHRRTQSELAGWRVLQALHRGSTPPVVRRRIERQTSSLIGTESR